MFKIIAMTSAILSASIMTAFAECDTMRFNQQPRTYITYEDKSIAIFGNDPYTVFIQDHRTCKIVQRNMTENQLFIEYGISDELEGECVDNPECGE